MLSAKSSPEAGRYVSSGGTQRTNCPLSLEGQGRQRAGGVLKDHNQRKQYTLAVKEARIPTITTVQRYAGSFDYVQKVAGGSRREAEGCNRVY